MLGDQECGHPWLVETNADPVTGGPRLCHLEFCLTDAVPVTDAHLIIRQTVDGEVLAENAPRQIRPTEESPPMVVGLSLVDHHRSLLATVTGQVPLTVAVQVQPSRHHPAIHRLFPDARVHQTAVPGNVARSADVDRKKPRHAQPSFARRGSREPHILSRSIEPPRTGHRHLHSRLIYVTRCASAP